ncbi:IS110 family transposase [Catellatospora sp. NPDC049609]|uniref:IS110 family transposase n=1 Tax=Catellatospora sp. NPDC049609 TaxID=3155505 RepID=UPI003431A8BA
MVILGIDAHKRSHTVVAVDEVGRKLGEKTLGTTTADHLALVTWADRFGQERRWAVEDCRHLSRRLERDLLAAGERITRVPPKLMANARDGARTYGKSDPIDALAVARAALREPDLPTAQLDGPDRDLRLLADYRDDLVAERTRVINRIRWQLHEIDPAWQPPARCLQRAKNLNKIAADLAGRDGIVPRLCRSLVQRCRELTEQITALDKELKHLVEKLAPALLEIIGCGTLTAAKIVGETAGVKRFRSRHAYARHNGTAPLPVWSGNRQRHRLSRVGNRQLNTAIHRIAITQAHYHQPARDFLQRRRADGDTTSESLRALKRRLSDVVFRALLTDA